MGNACRHGTQNKYLEDEGGSRFNKAFSKVDESLHDVPTNAEQAKQQEEIERLTSTLQAEIESNNVDRERLNEENTTLKSRLEQVIAERDMQISDISKLNEEITSLKINQQDGSNTDDPRKLNETDNDESYKLHETIAHLRSQLERVNSENEVKTSKLIQKDEEISKLKTETETDTKNEQTVFEEVLQLKVESTRVNMDREVQTTELPTQMLGLPVGATDENNTEHTRFQEEIELLKSELTRITAEREEQTQNQMKSEEVMTDLKHEIERVKTEREDQATSQMKCEHEMTKLKSELESANEGNAILTKELHAIKEDYSCLQNKLHTSDSGKGKLTHDLQELLKANEDIETQLQTSDTEKEKLNHDLQELQKARDILQTELQTSYTEKEKLKLDLQELQKTRTILQTELQKSDSEKEKLKHDLQDLQKARDLLQTDLNARTKEGVKLSTQYKDEQKTTQELQKKLQQLVSENEKVTHDLKEIQKASAILKTERQKAVAEIEQMKKDKQDLQKENGLLQNKLKSTSDDVAKLMNENNDKNKAQRQLRQDLDKANAELGRHKKDLLDVQTKCANLEKQLQQEKQRGNIQQHSLEKANAKPKTGASYLVNLSDENRPDKVAERFGKLYDDEWTDCLEVMSSEEKVCQMLLGICVKIYTTYAKAIDKRSHNEHALLKADTELAEYLNAFLKSLNRATADVAITSYSTKCKEVCKSMIAHDPPIYMDTDTNKHGAIFDAKLYEGYTKKGNQIDFVVWPALYLKKNGGLLRKGVVQCK